MSASTEGQRLIDYFVVCGLDNVSGLEPDQLLGDSLHVPPVERSYKAKTLAHYPENVSWNPFDEHAVCMLSLPNGLQFKLNTESPSPSFHSFLITREDGSRMNGFALTYYEKVKDFEICKAMQVLQDMFMVELTLNSTKNRSHSAVLFREHVEGFQRNSFSSPRPEIKLYDSEKHNLLVSKCLCLIMPLPFINAAKTCLTKIYQGGLAEEELNLTLECYLYNLIYEVPLPPHGKKMKFTCVTEEVLCQRPGLNELPLFDYSLEDVLALVGVNDFLKILSCVMLEHQILILGSDFYTFMLVSESVSSLIFPFNWQHVYVPILPASLLHFLEAPVPFVMGLYCKNSDDVEAFLPSKSSLCCLDINKRVLTVPEELPELPYAEELAQELSEVLAKYEQKKNAPSPSSGRSSPSQIPRNKSLDVRLTARKPVKKIHAMKAGLAQLKTSKSTSNLTTSQSVNPTLALLEKVAQKTGIQTNLPAENKETPNAGRELDTNHVVQAFKGLGPKELRQLAFNVEIREILVNWLTQIFLDYESFVIHPLEGQDMEQWIQNREQMENFDKAAFLSDQPALFLPFLAPFIETQMFASFIDTKLIGRWSEPDPKLAVFDQRISQMKNKMGNERSHSYERCQSIKSALQILSRRTNSIDHTAPAPHVLDVEIRRGLGDGFFPDLIEEALVLDNVDSGRRQPKVNWRRRDRQKQHSEHLLLNSSIKQEGRKIRQKLLANIKKHIEEKKTTKNPKSQLGDMSLNSSDAHMNFIEQLLSECRGKTKRMLVLKMGQEAKDLGHNDVKGVEENSLIASLCDLLDRIWGHGLSIRKAKSPLWFHLLSYYDSCEGDTMELTEDSFGLPCQKSAESSPVVPRRQHIRRSTSPEPTRIRTESPAGRRVVTGTKTLMADVRSVKNLSEIKTDTGCLRAFVRLALEKKALSKHLKTLLNDKDILRKYYQNYAFVRTEEEREQFLCYLISLNAVDYFCFTNCFTTLAITYKVVIVTGKQLGGSTTTANVWMILAGEIKDTGSIDVPKGECEFRFQHPNVGKLTTLRIGHDNSGYAPGWFVEQVSVRNEITGHLYRFPCGRWLAKNNDDGSTERLLVAELQQKQTNNNEESSVSLSLQRRSPVMPRKTPEKSSIPVVQENVANAVNNIVKYFCRPESTNEKGYLTYLLCGENGLCDSLDQVFQCGFKSARLFQKNFFIWDFIEKVYFYLNSEEGSFILTDHRRAKLSFCSVVQKINDASQSVGKDGKFQTFICLGARDHLLEEWFPLISVCPVTTHMYEQNSFLRDKDMVQFLVGVLRSLVEFNIVLEASLLKGIS